MRTHNMRGILAVVVVAIIAIVGYLAYTQGYFEGREEDESGIEINLGGDSEEARY